MKLRTLFLITAASLLAGGCSTVRKSPNFKERSAEITTLGIVEPSLSIEKYVFKGTNEMLFEDAKKSAGILKTALEQEFKKRGYAVNYAEASIQSSDAEMLDTLSRLKDRHASIAEDIQKQYVQKLKWSKFKMTLGSDVNGIADAAKADVLIFISGSGFVKSGGEHAGDIAKSLVIGAASLGHVVYVAPPYGGQVYLSVVDADNGDILWHNFTNPGVPRKLTDEKTLKSIAKEIIGRYPKAKRKPAVETMDPLRDSVQVKVPLEVTAKHG